MATSVWDLKNNVAFGVSLVPKAYTASSQGPGVDLQGTTDQAFAILDVGAVTDGTHTITITESKNDNTAAADGAAEAYQATVPASSFTAPVANTPQVINVVHSRRYLRAETTITGATTGATYGVLIGAQKKLY